jgi:hypothetical protein
MRVWAIRVLVWAISRRLNTYSSVVKDRLIPANSEKYETACLKSHTKNANRMRCERLLPPFFPYTHTHTHTLTLTLTHTHTHTQASDRAPRIRPADRGRRARCRHGNARSGRHRTSTRPARWRGRTRISSPSAKSAQCASWCVPLENSHRSCPCPYSSRTFLSIEPCGNQRRSRICTPPG